MTAHNYYLVEAPTGQIFVGSSMLKLTARINAGIKDQRRWLRHQGLSCFESKETGFATAPRTITAQATAHASAGNGRPGGPARGR